MRLHTHATYTAFRYANNFANVGSQTFDKPGKYLLSYNPENMQYGVRKDGVTGEYLGVINSPTPYGIFLARLVVFDDEDKKTVNGFQDTMKVTTVKRNSGALAPIFDRNIFVDVTKSTSGPVSEAEQVLRLTAALAQINPSEVVQDRSWIATTLEKAGIKNGKFTQPPGTSLDDAVVAANQSVQATVLSAGMMKPLGNSWTFSSPLISGDFHSFYSARHLVAMRGYLQPTADQSIYPSWYPKTQSPDGIGSACHIGPRQAILFTFSGKPRINHSGFWSLTIYNSAQLLVANQLDRYSLGDRSNLNYPDGKPLRDRADGKFEILVQPDDVVPPTKYMNNWLPAPAGGGLISFNLRVFAPAVEMLDGTYPYPEVTVIDAITPERRMSTRL